MPIQQHAAGVRMHASDGTTMQHELLLICSDE